MILYAGCVALFLYGVYRLLKIGEREPGLPPGPPTAPLFGNMLQMSRKGIEWQISEWHKQYGPIISLKFGSSTIIAIKDRAAIRDLWEKKSHIYSDRPPSYIGGILTKGDHAIFQPLGDEWRERRKVMSHHLSPQMCDKVHASYQNAETVALLQTLLEQPDEFYKLAKRYSTAITGVIVYGKRPKSFDDPLCKDVSAAMGYLGENMELGAAPPVDEWPFTILRYIPAQFAYWKRRALKHGQYFDGLWSKLYNEFRERHKTQGPSNCLFDKFIPDGSAKDENDIPGWRWGLHSLQFLGGEILEGGADTTSSTLISFIMAMACNPEVQRKAHLQIDAAIGPERTPTWDDYDKLPYVAQIQKETLRWRSVTVTGMPHMAREDDTYKGYHIPKGARLMQSTWALHNDEQYYEAPERFNPDRYDGRTKLADHYQGNPDWQNRDHFAYGGGRRICPGMHLAERTLWRSISKILWAFEILPATDAATGKPKPIYTAAFSANGEKVGFMGAANRVAIPFDVSIVPRSTERVETIKREYAEVLPLLSRYD